MCDLGTPPRLLAGLKRARGKPLRVGIASTILCTGCLLSLLGQAPAPDRQIEEVTGAPMRMADAVSDGFCRCLFWSASRGGVAVKNNACPADEWQAAMFGNFGAGEGGLPARHDWRRRTQTVCVADAGGIQASAWLENAPGKQPLAVEITGRSEHLSMCARSDLIVGLTGHIVAETAAAVPIIVERSCQFNRMPASSRGAVRPHGSRIKVGRKRRGIEKAQALLSGSDPLPSESIRHRADTPRKRPRKKGRAEYLRPCAVHPGADDSFSRAFFERQ